MDILDILVSIIELLRFVIGTKLIKTFKYNPQPENSGSSVSCLNIHKHDILGSKIMNRLFFIVEAGCWKTNFI